MVHVDMIGLILATFVAGGAGYFVGLLWGVRRMSDLLADLHEVACARDYYRSLLPDRDRTGKFTKKEHP